MPGRGAQNEAHVPRPQPYFFNQRMAAHEASRSAARQGTQTHPSKPSAVHPHSRRRAPRGGTSGRGPHKARQSTSSCSAERPFQSWNRGEPTTLPVSKMRSEVNLAPTVPSLDAVGLPSLRRSASDATQGVQPDKRIANLPQMQAHASDIPRLTKGSHLPRRPKLAPCIGDQAQRRIEVSLWRPHKANPLKSTHNTDSTRDRRRGVRGLGGRLNEKHVASTSADRTKSSNGTSGARNLPGRGFSTVPAPAIHPSPPTRGGRRTQCICPLLEPRLSTWQSAVRGGSSGQNIVWAMRHLHGLPPPPPKGSARPKRARTTNTTPCLEGALTETQCTCAKGRRVP